jgi:undecaprenyl-diphosphatase
LSCYNSFPSDHTAVIAAVTTAIGLYLLFILKASVQFGAQAKRMVSLSLAVRRRFVPQVALAVTLFLVAAATLCWIGLARVYTGVHYPGDILAGTLCGFLGSVFAVALRPVVAPLLLTTFRLAERVYLA